MAETPHNGGGAPPFQARHLVSSIPTCPPKPPTPTPAAPARTQVAKSCKELGAPAVLVIPSNLSTKEGVETLAAKASKAGSLSLAPLHRHAAWK